MRRRLLLECRILRPSFPSFRNPEASETYAVLAFLSKRCPPLKGRLPTCYSPVRRFTDGRSHFLARLACVRPAANVRSEPGSNSPVKSSNADPEGPAPLTTELSLTLLELNHNLRGSSYDVRRRTFDLPSNSVCYSAFRDRRLPNNPSEGPATFRRPAFPREADFTRFFRFVKRDFFESLRPLGTLWSSPQHPLNRPETFPAASRA